MCTSKHPDIVNHKVEVRQWEKKLRQDTGENSTEKQEVKQKSKEGMEQKSKEGVEQKSGQQRDDRFSQT